MAQYLPAGSYQQAEMRYGDITESYRFKVLDCYHRKIGRDGKHYAWYHIADVTMTQRDDAPMKRAAQLAANLDYLSMMVDVALPNEGV